MQKFNLDWNFNNKFDIIKDETFNIINVPSYANNKNRVPSIKSILNETCNGEHWIIKLPSSLTNINTNTNIEITYINCNEYQNDNIITHEYIFKLFNNFIQNIDYLDEYYIVSTDVYSYISFMYPLIEKFDCNFLRFMIQYKYDNKYINYYIMDDD